MTTFPDILPSFSSSSSTEASVLEARFGDNYSMRAASGINSIVETWTLIFQDISNTDIETIRAFLVARGGYESFGWTPPGESTEKKYVCKSWVVTPSGYNISSLNATFRQEFDL